MNESKQSNTTLHIKNMVSHRCILAVAKAISDAGLTSVNISLGISTVEGEPSKEQILQFQRSIESIGFELIEDKKHKVIELIKAAIIKLVQKDFIKDLEHANISDYLIEETGYDYSYISTLFSSSEGITIEKFIILQKIERIKELLSYKELNLSQISAKMGYSSVHALSNQFKKITAVSPSDYRSHAIELRKPLDKLTL